MSGGACAAPRLGTGGKGGAVGGGRASGFNRQLRATATYACFMGGFNTQMGWFLKGLKITAE